MSGSLIVKLVLHYWIFMTLWKGEWALDLVPLTQPGGNNFFPPLLWPIEHLPEENSPSY